jgi:hypothetical protein
MICLHFENFIKGQYYGYQMKGLDVGSKNALLFFDFRPFLLELIVSLCFIDVNKRRDLFTFLKNLKRSSIWISNERSKPRE